MAARDRERRDGALAALLALSTAQSAVGRQFARSQHLHTTDATALVEIITAEDRGQPLTPARLAERISLTTGATSTLLNRLEEAGHVSRVREHTDRRIVTLRITPASHELADAFYAPLAEQLDATMRGFSSDDLAAVEDLARRLTGSMHEYVDDKERENAPPRSASSQTTE